ncbi:lysophospholipid acyltransferase family protein [Hyalangium rubrum]|uniref:Lysophospholipid acyltransferase family protein n=1 Tax=Hyalangium rubrum TaxID=3103134 RepID=A0ABU5H177_9BACT|nr:lysophospholipid acyltransferase family protein [Hyalangium sp. s54d21]MDY7227213.1 lysophospholipid acyltransferase family protein [Hyalangium sp. s54d21]
MSRSTGARTALNIAVSSGLVTLTALAMLVARAVTFGRARRFCAEVLGAWMSRAILRQFGVTLVLHEHGPRTTGPCVYTFNHTSTLDMFILLALRLPRTRYFMKRRSWVFPSFGLAAWMVGTFFTPPQRLPRARVRCFQAATAKLQRTGDSVLLSPEGTRVTTGKIGPFNKGTFHLATEIQAPIVPLFIQIPPEGNPGKGLAAHPCTVHVHVLPPVPTTGWRLEDLERNKEHVRQRYVDFLAHLNAEGTPSLPTAA